MPASSMEPAVGAATPVGGTTDAIVARVLHADGTYRHLESRAANLGDSVELGRWVVTARDVTDRVEAQGALAENEARFRFLAENSSDLISRHDARRGAGHETDLAGHIHLIPHVLPALGGAGRYESESSDSTEAATACV